MTNIASLSPIVQFIDVSRTYQVGQETVQALTGINLSCSGGSFWAIMGPSGSGKSTLLNLLGCLDRPSRGQYLLEGRDVAQLSDDELSLIRLQRLGFIFQSFNLVAQLTVLENIELPLFYQGLSTREGHLRAKRLAETVGLSKRLQHRPTELSGGQQQRVAIARALVNDPALILADEPTGNLDSATGEQIMQILTDFNRQGKTIIMVTHEGHIAEYATKKIYMKDGCIKHIDGG